MTEKFKKAHLTKAGSIIYFIFSDQSVFWWYLFLPWENNTQERRRGNVFEI
jgi:hypothetical protein